jgi:hypothetical protein
MIRKISLALMLSLFLQLSVSALSEVPFQQYADLDDVEYRESIVWTLSRGITQGYNANEWKPEECITRAQIVKMMLEYTNDFRGGFDGLESKTNVSAFNDVDRDDWFYEYVNYGYKTNMIEGYSDGSFKPNQCVNRAEAMKIAVEAMIYDDLINNQSAPLFFDDKAIVDMSVAAWYSDYARTMFENRLVGTNHTMFTSGPTDQLTQINFFPEESMSRKEVAKMMYETNKYIEGQIRNGDLYNNKDYGFEVNLPSTWGDVSVINDGPGFFTAIVDQFQITSEDEDQIVYLYVIDKNEDYDFITDLPYNYIGENNDYALYTSWTNILGDTDNSKLERKKQSTNIFKVESNIKIFDL